MRLSSIAAVALILLGTAAARGEEPGDAVAGRAYAEAVCARCHAVLPNETASPASDATPFETIANTSGMTGTALAVWLQTSHPTMPNLVLKKDDIHNVIAYILSLKQ